jgi:hypothetical protein
VRGAVAAGGDIVGIRGNSAMDLEMGSGSGLGLARRDRSSSNSNSGVNCSNAYDGASSLSPSAPPLPQPSLLIRQPSLTLAQQRELVSLGLL